MLAAIKHWKEIQSIELLVIYGGAILWLLFYPIYQTVAVEIG